MEEMLAKLDQIQRRTGCGLPEAKAAYDASGGDVEAAIRLVRERAGSAADGTGGPGPTGGGSPAGGAGPAPGDSEQRILAAVAHGGSLVGFPVLVPLVIYLLVQQNPFVRSHAKQALAWQLTVLAGSLVLAATIVGAVLVPVLVVAGLVFTVIALLRAAQGEPYRYPFIGDWVAGL